MVILRKLRSHSNDFTSKNSKNVKLKSKPHSKMKNSIHSFKDIPKFDEDDFEIRRLEKLLKIDSKKNKEASAAKLNKEFEENEGISGGFGSFLMSLDNLTESINDTSTKSYSFPTSKHIDIDLNVPLNEKSDDFSSHESIICQNSTYDNDLTIMTSKKKRQEFENSNKNVSVTSSVDSIHEKDIYQPVKGEDIYGRSKDIGVNNSNSQAKYIPPSKRLLLNSINSNSETITLLQRTMNGMLNRLSDQSKDSVTRSMRQLFENNSLNISNNILKSCLMSVCSKSDQTMVTLIPIYAGMISVLHMTVSKDIGAYLLEHLVVLIIQGLANSSNHLNYWYYQSLLITVSLDNHESIAPNNENTLKVLKQHAYIGDKCLINYLLIILYFYNLKILHHKLIIDLLQTISHKSIYSQSSINNTTGANIDSNRNKVFSELELELIVCIIEHSGHLLRKDDPVEFKNIINNVVEKISNNNVHNNSNTNMNNAIENEYDNDSRYLYFIETLNQLSSFHSGIGHGKSQRILNKYQENTSILRKWIGTMKSSIIHTNSSNNSHSTSVSRHGQVLSSDTCLGVTLQDLLNAEIKGRWWRAGAFWQNDKNQSILKQTQESHNRNNNNNNDMTDDLLSINKKQITATVTTASSEEETKLLSLAKKLKFNTLTRKNIFLVIMTSADMNDAYERLMRLDFKGKEEREIVRVVTECCAQEKIFNLFYYELLNILCLNNRQFKTTCQFVIYDFMKTIEQRRNTDSNEDDGGSIVDEKIPKYRVMNMAYLTSHLIKSFHISISMLKRIDMSNLSKNMILFVSTLFLSLFTIEIENEDAFENIFDRVATASDFHMARDNIVYFLQSYLKVINADILNSFIKNSDKNEIDNLLGIVKKRKKVVLTVMEQMDILCVTKAQNDLQQKSKKSRKDSTYDDRDDDFD